MCKIVFVLLHTFVLCIAHYCTSLFAHGLKSHFCMALARIALALSGLPGLTHQQVKAGEVTLTRQTRKTIQENVWRAQKMSNII